MVREDPKLNVINAEILTKDSWIIKACEVKYPQVRFWKIRKIVNNRIYGLGVRVFANGPGDLISIPGRVIPKTQKMVLDASLLNTRHYKVRIKGKVEQSREGVAPSPTTWCSSYRKGSLRVNLDSGRQLYLLIYIYIYIYKLCVDIGCSLEDLLGVMENRKRFLEGCKFVLYVRLEKDIQEKRGGRRERERKRESK